MLGCCCVSLCSCVWPRAAIISHFTEHQMDKSIEKLAGKKQMCVSKCVLLSVRVMQTMQHKHIHMPQILLDV